METMCGDKAQGGDLIYALGRGEGCKLNNDVAVIIVYMGGQVIRENRPPPHTHTHKNTIKDGGSTAL